MLPPALEKQFNDFYHAAYADGELDGKTKVLIGMAVADDHGLLPMNALLPWRRQG